MKLKSSENTFNSKILCIYFRFGKENGLFWEESPLEDKRVWSTILQRKLVQKGSIEQVYHWRI